jgi:membrane protein
MISLDKKIFTKVQTILDVFQEHRLNAAAAHAAFFIILSFIPCVILLFSLLQFTSIDKVTITVMIQKMLPREMQTFFAGIIRDAYNRTASTVSLSALVTVWSAGRGMMALTQGLQWIAGIKESRNYFAVRFRATLYTVVMLLSIIVFLLLGVFGNALLNIIAVRFPIATYAVEIIIDIKNVFLLLFATVIFTLIYRFMPGNEIPLSQHLPGAVVSSLGWFLFSYAFSVYVDDFSGFSNMYGSLTALILLMLWLYFGMYITLIGAEFNQLLVKRREKP